MNMILRAACCGMILVSVAACEPPVPLSEYKPVVDPATISQGQFNKDLQDCRNIALQVEADYKKRQQKELGQHLLAGLLVGAITGAVVGGGVRRQMIWNTRA